MNCWWTHFGNYSFFFNKYSTKVKCCLKYEAIFKEPLHPIKPTVVKWKLACEDARVRARLISSSVTSSRVQSIQRFCCQAFVFWAIKGSRASGQVGVYGRMIHPLVWSIKTNLRCGIGHWSSSFYVPVMSIFLRWYNVNTKVRQTHWFVESIE